MLAFSLYENGIVISTLFTISIMQVNFVLDFRHGQVSLLFTSPEAIMAPHRLKTLQRYGRRIGLVAYDEVHCLSEW